MKRPDYRTLQALDAVIRERGFERAAQKLCITQSAVSQRIKQLENMFGQPLLVRTVPPRPTEQGQKLLALLRQVELLEEEWLGDEQTGSTPLLLSLAVNADSLATWFVAAATRMADEAALLLDISLEDQEHTAERLRRGEVVAAVTALDKPVPGCRSVPLGTLVYRATASPAFVARWFPAGVDAQALARAPCLTFNRQDRLQQQWVARVLGDEAAVPALATHWLPSTQAFVDASLAGLGWGMNPEPLVRPWLDSGHLVELLPGRALGVPLYWQCRQGLPVAPLLTRAVCEAAAAVLPPSADPVR